MIIAQSITSAKRSRHSDHVEREAVGRSRGHAQQRRARPCSRSARMPSHTASLRVADAIGVVQQQHVEAVDAAALEAALGGHAQVLGVALGPAQARVGEAGEALAARRAHPRRSRARRRPPGSSCSRRRPASARPSSAVRVALAVDVGCDHRVDAAPGRSSEIRRSSSSGSPKCMKRPPLQVPIAVVGGLHRAVQVRRRCWRARSAASSRPRRVRRSSSPSPPRALLARRARPAPPRGRARPAGCTPAESCSSSSTRSARSWRPSAAQLRERGGERAAARAPRARGARVEVEPAPAARAPRRAAAARAPPAARRSAPGARAPRCAPAASARPNRRRRPAACSGSSRACGPATVGELLALAPAGPDDGACAARDLVHVGVGRRQPVQIDDAVDDRERLLAPRGSVALDRSSSQARAWCSADSDTGSITMTRSRRPTPAPRAGPRSRSRPRAPGRPRRGPASGSARRSGPSAHGNSNCTNTNSRWGIACTVSFPAAPAEPPPPEAPSRRRAPSRDARLHLSATTPQPVRSLRDRLGGNAEERLGKALSELLESPLFTGAIGRAFDAREKAAQAQEVALGALNLPSAADIERLTRRMRSVSQRLEAIEDGVERLDSSRLAERRAPASSRLAWSGRAAARRPARQARPAADASSGRRAAGAGPRRAPSRRPPEAGPPARSAAKRPRSRAKPPGEARARAAREASAKAPRRAGSTRRAQARRVAAPGPHRRPALARRAARLLDAPSARRPLPAARRRCPTRPARTPTGTPRAGAEREQRGRLHLDRERARARPSRARRSS